MAVYLAADVVPFSNVVSDKNVVLILVLTILNCSKSVRWHLTKKKESAMNTLSNMERMNLSNAKALRRAREQLKVTKVEMARKLNVSVKTIDRIENGDGHLTEGKIEDVLNALEIGTEEFFQGKKRPRTIPTKARKACYRKCS